MIWFKLYHSILNDEKFTSIREKYPKIKSDTIGWTFVNILTLASMGEERGSIRLSQMPEVAYLCERPQATIRKIFNEFVTQNILATEDGYYRIVNWEKYQQISGNKENESKNTAHNKADYKRSLGNERVKRYREKQRCNAVTQDVTLCNANRNAPVTQNEGTIGEKEDFRDQNKEKNFNNFNENLTVSKKSNVSEFGNVKVFLEKKDDKVKHQLLQMFHGVFLASTFQAIVDCGKTETLNVFSMEDVGKQIFFSKNAYNAIYDTIVSEGSTKLACNPTFAIKSGLLAAYFCGKQQNKLENGEGFIKSAAYFVKSTGQNKNDLFLAMEDNRTLFALGEQDRFQDVTTYGCGFAKECQREFVEGVRRVSHHGGVGVFVSSPKIRQSG